MNQKFKEQCMSLMGIGSEQFDNIYSELPFKGIRINEKKANFEKVQKSFSFALEKTPFYKDEYYVPKNASGLGNNPFHHAGGFYVQEPSASSVLSILNVKKGSKVLDLCAAPGGKSTGIGIEQEGSGILWSNEYVRKRAAALLSNLERMGISGAAVSSFDADYLCSNLAGFFDTVLVDAPCSGEGMWRHNEMVEEQWSEEYVDECAKRQREILSAAANAVISGGRLIYSTCTFNKKENEETVVWFLEHFENFSLKKIEADFGRGGLSGNEQIDQKVKRIFPSDGGEGHFIALFERENDGNCYLGEYVKEDISKKEKEIVEAFLRENFQNDFRGNFVSKNGLIYIVPEGMPKVKGDVLRMGLFIGEIRGNRLEPSHALFVAFGPRPKRILNLDLSDERVTKFLKGMEIPADTTENGYTAVAVEGVVFGFGKASNGRITNKYPKGLRLMG